MKTMFYILERSLLIPFTMTHNDRKGEHYKTKTIAACFDVNSCVCLWPKKHTEYKTFSQYLLKTLGPR